MFNGKQKNWVDTVNDFRRDSAVNSAKGEGLMESARLSRIVRSVRGATVSLATAISLLLVPTALIASHKAPTGNDGGECADCHNLSSSPGAVESGTSLIITGTRTLTSMKAANGSVVPATFGCTFCHNNPANTAMKGVLNHFTQDVSRHPIGEKFNGWTGARANTNNEYLSNINGNTAAATAELECLDCHDINLAKDPVAWAAGAFQHVTRGTGDRDEAKNPMMLKSVTVAGQLDDFCRLCHGNGVSSVKGVDIRVTSHKDGGDTGTNAITEADGTILKTGEGSTVDGVAEAQTSQCTSCHDEHSSSLVKLFNDGKKDTAIATDNCTSVCHYGGDYTDNYNRHGHGKDTTTYMVGGIIKDLKKPCTACHGTIDLTTTNVLTRKKHAEKSPSGTDQEKYQKRYNLTDKPQTADAGTPGGNPLWGICIGCHSLDKYKEHKTSGGNVGCQDCHDEHAENSGLNSNVFMIPEKGRPSGTYKTPTAPRTGSEDVLYTTTYLNPSTMLPRGSGYEFYRADGKGICDNMECHGTSFVPGGTPGPLGTLMTNSNHTAGNQVAGADCAACHQHSSATGSWIAVCTDCHGDTTTGNIWPDSGTTHGTVYPNRAGDHVLHINAIAIARYGAGATIEQKNKTCGTCHPTPGATGHDTDVAPLGIADVHGDSNNTATSFKTITGAANSLDTDTYDNSTGINGKFCANVDCHYRVNTPVAGAVQGTNGDGWYNFTNAPATCSNCHGMGYIGAALPNAHTTHVDTTLGKGFGCTECHADRTSMAHENGSVEMSFLEALDPGSSRTEQYTGGTGAVKFGAAGTYGRCYNTYCHGNFTNGTTANAPKWDTVADGNCGTCHGGNGTGNLTVVSSGKHTDHLSAAWGPYFGIDGCAGTSTGCHTTSLLTDTTHVDGSVQFGNINQTTFTASTLGATATLTPTETDTDRCTYCHSTTSIAGYGVGAAQAKANWAGAGFAVPCLSCHNSAFPSWRYADGTGVRAPAKDVYFGTTGHGRPTASGNYPVTNNPPANFTSTLAPRCTVCHLDTAVHISNSLEDSDRLRSVTADAYLYTTTTSEVCLNCHKVGQTTNGTLGYDAVNEATVHSGGVTVRYNTAALAPGAFPAYGDAASYVTNPGYQCQDCHDVHGTQRLAMILDTIDGKVGGVSNPKALAAGVLISGTDTDLTDLDPSSAADNGVCDLCHTTAGYPHPDSLQPTPGNHNWGTTGNSCMRCHDHKKSFQGACFGCHGNTVVGNWWPDSAAEHGTVYPNRVGDHELHITAIATIRFGASPTVANKNSTCGTCHPNPGAIGHDTNVAPTGISDVHGDTNNTATSFRNISNITNTVANDTYDNSTGANGKKCTNVDCHWRTTTPTTGTANANGDGWYKPTETLALINCGSCHGTATSGTLPNLHFKHVAPNPTGKNYACTNCHLAAVATYTVAHQNGTINNSFVGVLDPVIGGPRTETYTGTNVPKYGGSTTGVCNNFYCHGNFTDGNTGNAPNWTTVSTGQCGTCHGGDGTAGDLSVITTGNHTDHLTAAWGPNFGNSGCAGTTTGCHTAGTLATATHVDGSVTFDNIAASPASSTLGLTATLTPTATDTDRCTYCHSTTNIPNYGIGAGLAKDNWGTGEKQPCLTCHNAEFPSWRYADGTGVRAPAKDTYFETTGHGRPTASGVYPATGNVAANYTTTITPRCTVCHAETSAHISSSLNDSDRLNSVAGDALAYTKATSEVCLDCHKVGQSTTGTLGYDAVNEASVHSGGVSGKFNTSVLAPNAYPAYGNSADYATSPGYQCEVCHDVHGTQRLAMILDTLDGNLGGASNPKVLPAGVFVSGTDTDLTDLDPSSVADNGVCDQCHKSSGTTTAHPDSNHANNHNQGNTGTSCMGCHDHTKSFQGGCDGCHGNQAGSVIPNGLSPNGIAYPNKQGSHTNHVSRLVTSYSFTESETCTVCHPGYPPPGHSTDSVTGSYQAEVSRMDTDGNGFSGPPTAGDYWKYAEGPSATSGTAVYFKDSSKANDTLGYYRTTDNKCYNSTCHGGNGSISPDWTTGATDTVPPVFNPNNTITVTNPATDGDLQVSWNPAEDTLSPPVVYDIYRYTGTIADACASGSVIVSNFGSTSYFASGLTNGQAYSFCVKAKDSWPTPNTANTTTATATPTAPTAGCSTGTNATIYTSMGGVAAGIDGNQAPTTLGSATAYVTNGARRPMQIGSTALSANSVWFQTWPSTGTYLRSGRYYLQQGGICVGPNLTAGNLVKRSSSTTDMYQLRLVDYDPLGTSYNGTTIATSANYAATTTTSAQAFTMTFTQYQVPSGHNLVLEVWNSVVKSTNITRFYGGGTTTTTGTYFTVPLYTPTVDSTPPVFAGATSAIDSTEGGTAIVSWTFASDAFPSNPINYDVYGLQTATKPSAATLFQTPNIVASNILEFTTKVTGLTNGLPYFFGVRATDAANNTDANTVVKPDVTGVIPTSGGGSGMTCSSCHPLQMITGAHDKHVPTGLTEAQLKAVCDKCHTSSTVIPSTDYTMSGPALHNDGPPAEVYLLRSMPSETNASYTKTSLFTCQNVDCHYNVSTPDWANGISYCSNCHAYGTGMPWPNEVSHNTHFASWGVGTITDAAAPAYCNYCHTGYGYGTASHADGNKYEVAISSLFQDKSGGAMVYSPVGASGTCTNVSCHGGKETPAWGTPLSETTEDGCNSCHTYGTLEYNSASSGKHLAHAPSLPTPCTTCHAGVPVAGHFLIANLTTSAMINPTTFNSANLITYTDSTTTGPPYFNATGSSGTCASVATSCHTNGALWDPNAVGGCNFCHGYPPTSSSDAANNKHAVGATPVNHDKTPGSTTTLKNSHDDCGICHGTKDSGTGIHAPYTTPGAYGNDGSGFDLTYDHRDGNIELNGPTPTTGAGYNQTNFGCDKACHLNDAAHRLSDSALTVEFNDYGAGGCSSCHNGTTSQGYAGLLTLTTTKHMMISRTVSATACSACHPGGTRGTMHGNGTTQVSGVVAIPNYTVVGINYAHTVGSGVSGFVLGGDNTSGTSEAEICWNCHANAGSPVVSEWGTNTAVSGMPATTLVGRFDYGTLNQRNWIGATWTSAQTVSPSFSYKTGLVKSTHTANPSGAPWNGPTSSANNNAGTNPDTVGQIRCSYCHDVHDLNKAGTPVETATGKPWLRGNWISNPYKQDGAPQSGQTYSNAGSWGLVPRGSSNVAQSMGGYWIDRNMANPTSGMTYDQFGGLCALCHSATKGSSTWTAAGVSAINQFDASGAGWVSGLNGHKNAVKGASGTTGDATASRNIYNARGGTGPGSTAHNPLQHYQGHSSNPGDSSYGFRGYSSNALRYQPTQGATGKYSQDEWSVDEYGTVAQSLYHQFSCSKCHMPHASRLPKLMLTNCLDTKHNTWDNLTTYTVISQTSAVNKGRSRSNMSSAVNCHRLVGEDTADTRDSIGYSGAGWNTVTPW